MEITAERVRVKGVVEVEKVFGCGDGDDDDVGDMLWVEDGVGDEKGRELCGESVSRVDVHQAGISCDVVVDAGVDGREEGGGGGGAVFVFG